MKYLLFFLFPLFVFSQSKKDIRKNNIKGITEVVTEYENGKESTHNDVSKKFDKEGEVIQEINYDKNGALKEKVLTKNNKDGDKIEEVIYDANGKQNKRFTYKYDSYGEKTEELQYDAKNALLTKSVYAINAKGLKTEKKTYDAKGKLIQVKKYVYEYRQPPIRELFMTTDHFFNKIKEEADKFEPITLAEMDGVKLMDRMDVKYLIPMNLLPDILSDARQFYRLLEINNQRLCPYQTLYYDTEDLRLYHLHQVGKQNRYKVRSRNYVGSDLQFFEVKFKNNKGRTIKKRIKTDGINEPHLADESSEFLTKISPLEPDNLQGIMWVNYTRLTLVSKNSAERFTIDLELTFKNNTKEVQYAQIAIAEIKQEKIGASPILDIFKKHHLKEGSISKYCFGIISLFEGVKQNNFKKHLKRITKTLHQYESFTANAIA